MNIETYHNVDSPINPESIGHLFSLSTWQSAIGLIFVLITVLIISFILIKFKSKKMAMIAALIIGVIGMGIFGMIFHFTPPETYDEMTLIDLINEAVIIGDWSEVVEWIQTGGEVTFITWEDEVRDWLSILTTMFISGLLLIVPLYIFTAIVSFIIDENSSKIGKKTYGTSTLTLMMLPLIGILIALLTIPLINLIDTSLLDGLEGGSLSHEGHDHDTSSTITDILSTSVGSSLAIFVSPESLLSVVIFGIIIGFIVKTLKKDNEDYFKSTKKFFEILKKIISKYLEIIMILLPFAIATRMAMILMNNSPGNEAKLIGIWLGIYALGSIIIFTITFVITISISTKEKSFKEKSSAILEHSLFAFVNPNIIATLPSTQKTSITLGAKDEIANLTPTKGTFMGLIMCAGFMPMLVVLTTAHFDSGITWHIVLIAIPIIFAISIGTVGMGHADMIVVLSALGTLGLSETFYLSVALILSPITETVATVNNTNAHISATLITNKVYTHTSDNIDFIKTIPFEGEFNEKS